MLAEKMCQNATALLPPNAAPPGSLGILGASWISLTMLAMLVSLFGVALVYIFASFLRNQQLLAWTKFEFFQIVATAIIAAFMVSTVIGMCSFDVSFLDPGRYGQPGRENMYQIVDSYFAELEKLSYMIYGMIMYVTRIFSFLGRVTMLSNPLGVGSVENPLESVGQINSLIFYMLSGYVVSYLLINLQARMLDYLALACLYYLLPFGIFFRAFEPTRKFGGTLLGLSLAMFLFYPIILVFNDQIAFGAIENAQNAMTNPASGALAVANENLAQNRTPDNPNNWKNVSTNMSTLGSTTAFQSFVSGATGAPLFLMQFVMIYFIAAAMLPLVNFILLVSIARTLTHTFGEEIDVSNLTRLI